MTCKTTHHAACDCREAAHVAEVSRLREALAQACAPASARSGPSLEVALDHLAARIRYARAVHPDGATFAALMDEVDEVHAEEPDSERERDELLDVACVALRLWMGEREPVIRPGPAVQAEHPGEW